MHAPTPAWRGPERRRREREREGGGTLKKKKMRSLCSVLQLTRGPMGSPAVQLVGGAGDSDSNLSSFFLLGLGLYVVSLRSFCFLVKQKFGLVSLGSRQPQPKPRPAADPLLSSETSYLQSKKEMKKAAADLHRPAKRRPRRQSRFLGEGCGLHKYYVVAVTTNGALFVLAVGQGAPSRCTRTQSFHRQLMHQVVS